MNLLLIMSALAICFLSLVVVNLLLRIKKLEQDQEAILQQLERLLKKHYENKTVLTARYMNGEMNLTGKQLDHL